MKSILFMTVLSACAVSTDAPTDDLEGGKADGDGARCDSDLGTVVSIVAQGGRSTVHGSIDSHANRLVRGPLVDGAQIDEALVDLVSHAKREVLLQFYEIDERGWMAGELKKAIAALPPTVPVYIMTNPGTNRGALGLPESEGACRDRLKQFFDFPNVTTGAWHAPDLGGFLAMHTKLAVVDGARALVTDANVQPQATPIEHGGSGWFQLGMIVEGTIGRQLRGDVVSAWQLSGNGVVLPAPPPLAPAAGCTHMTVLSREAGDTIDKDCSSTAADKAGCPSSNFGISALLLGAEQSARVITPNLNDIEATDAIARATETADVYLMMSQHFDDFEDSLPWWGGNNEKGLAALVAQVKQPCRLHVRWFAREPGVAIQGNVEGASHSKWCSADGKVMVLGSQNLDRQSWRRSRELNVAVDDAVTTQAFDRVFQTAWDRSPTAFECAQ